VAGKGGSGGKGSATKTALHGLEGLAVDGRGGLLIAEVGESRILRLDLLKGTLEVVSGSGQAGFFGDGGLATKARFSVPRSVAIAPNGDLLVADTGNGRIRRVSSNVP